VEVGFEPTRPRIFPDFVLEYAGWKEIPELGISCGLGNGRGPSRVKRLHGAAGVRTVVGGHPNLPADGQEEDPMDPMAITERHQIRQSTHRNSAPNAESARLRTGRSA
jgi:hypothetical protein